MAKIKAKLNGEDVAPDDTPTQSDEVAEVAVEEENAAPVEGDKEDEATTADQSADGAANDLGLAMNL